MTPATGFCSVWTPCTGSGPKRPGRSNSVAMCSSPVRTSGFRPRGTGIVWVRRDAWDRMTAVIPTFSGPSFGNWFDNGTAPFVFGLDGTPGGFHSFEHRWALTDAFAFHQAIGKDRVAARTAELATRLKDGLAELSHVGLVTPRDPGLSSGIVCCDVTGRPPRRGGRRVAEQAPDRRERDAVPGSLRPIRPVHRDEHRGGRRCRPSPSVDDIGILYGPRGTTVTGSRARRISRDETPPSSTRRAGP